MRSSSAIRASSWLRCSLSWKSMGAFSRNSVLHLETILGFEVVLTRGFQLGS